jgi:hypothetical protein
VAEPKTLKGLLRLDYILQLLVEPNFLQSPSSPPFGHFPDTSTFIFSIFDFTMRITTLLAYFLVAVAILALAAPVPAKIFRQVS